MSDEQKPTLGAQWRKEREEGVLVRLPVSRRLVRLRTVRPDMLLRRGRIPDPLSNLVVSMIYGKATNAQMDAFLEPREQVEQALETMDSLSAVCEAALVEPRIVDEPLADDEIAIADLEYADMGYIFRLAFAPAEALSRFRHQPQADVDVMADEPVDAQQAV